MSRVHDALGRHTVNAAHAGVIICRCGRLYDVYGYHAHLVRVVTTATRRKATR